MRIGSGSVWQIFVGICKYRFFNSILYISCDFEMCNLRSGIHALSKIYLLREPAAAAAAMVCNVVSEHTPECTCTESLLPNRYSYLQLAPKPIDVFSRTDCSEIAVVPLKFFKPNHTISEKHPKHWEVYFNS